MTFLASWASWFLLGVPLIVLLYLMKVRRRPTRVPSLMFWSKVLEKNRHRALLGRLRNLTSLLLNLLIFLLLLGALARPTFHRWRPGESSIVIAIDQRARMQAQDSNGRTRFQQALEAVKRLLRDASSERQIAILSIAPSPEILCPFTGDPKILEDSLQGCTATDASGDLNAALELARSLLSARQGSSKILVFTDAPPHPPAAMPDTEFVCFGKPADNIAITAFSARPLFSDPQTQEVFLEAQNFGNQPVETTVELSMDGTLLDVRPLKLASGESSKVSFPALSPQRGKSGMLTARIAAKDPLPLDNVAYTILVSPKPIRVLLVSKGNWFLEKLLKAGTLFTFDLLRPESFQMSVATQFDAVIFDDFQPSEFQLGNTPGNFLFVKSSPFSTNRNIAAPIVPEADGNHPVMRLVNLQDAIVSRATALEIPEAKSGWEFSVPLRTGPEALMLTASGPGQRLAALSFDLADSDLPLRVAFPLLISNTLNWLATHEAAQAATIATGTPVSTNPGETIREVPGTMSATGSGLPSPVIKQGFYRIEKPGVSSRLIAASLFSSAESDLRAPHINPVNNVNTLIPGTVTSRFAAWPPWWYLASAALILLLLEWRLFHRRHTE